MLPADTHTSQIQVKFVTRHPDIAVSTAPVLVPSSLKRLGLSKVVNHLLVNHSAQIPFDFLVNGVFLRSSLLDYVTENGISTESSINLEYLCASQPPSYISSFQHDDWVSSVSSLFHDNIAAFILSGSYDGIARLWNMSGDIVGEAPGHTAPIKDAKWIDQKTFITSSMDRSLRMWELKSDDAEDALSLTCNKEYIGHTSTVDAIAVSSIDQKILSASSDGTVAVWSSTDQDNNAPSTIIPSRFKRQKLVRKSESIFQAGPLGVLRGHTAPVTGVIFAPQYQHVGYSVSCDHSIRTWDISTMTLVDTRSSQHPILSICAIPTLSLLACGTSARHLTLNDLRASSTNANISILRGHTNAVVSISKSPSSEWQIASGSHDGTVRIWDIRASRSGNLFTINRDEQNFGYKCKVLDVEWSKVGIVSAGDDKRIQINGTDSSSMHTLAK